MNALTEMTGSNEKWLHNSLHSNHESGKKAVNGANGMSDIEGKVTRVGARMEPQGREQHRWANREVEMRGST